MIAMRHMPRGGAEKDRQEKEGLYTQQEGAYRNEERKDMHKLGYAGR